MKRFITNATWAEIRTAYASGIGLREIARNVNIPEGTVLARAKREGWTREIQKATKEGTIRVLDMVFIIKDKNGNLVDGEFEDQSNELKKMLAEVMPSDPSVEFEHRLVVGSPASAILHLAEQKGVDLIVMPTHGRTGSRT